MMNIKKDIIKKNDVVICFSGDSGDGMQLTGTLFSDTSILDGNDIITFPDYPSEVRAPQGTVGGVSGFQVHIGDSKIYSPGDYADIIVAMNPAALKVNAKLIKPDGIIIIDEDNFVEKNIKKAGYKKDPIKESGLEDTKIIKVSITKMTKEALKDLGLDGRSILLCRNMFALGMICWLLDKSLNVSIDFINKKFEKKPLIAKANKIALKAGYNYADIIEAVKPYHVKHAKLEKGTYRKIDGTTAASWGLIAAAEKSGRELFLGSYPITPATGILQELSKRKDLGVKTFQAEDEIAAICSVVGASFAGDLAVTSTSGPGLALKAEGAGLAVMAELPVVIINVQRGGPSTGLPTKTEQSDLMQALYGRSGEAPLVVIAASTSSDCFNFAFEACKIALEHMVPVILMLDGYLVNSSEPWKIPDMSDLPKIYPPIVKQGTKNYVPYKRDKKTLARGWAIPGTKGLEHILGGLEKNEQGDISYAPENHQEMCELRAEKVKRVENYIPKLKVEGDKSGDLLVVGWGGTYGQLSIAVRELRKQGKSIGLAHFNYINPLPKNTENIFSKFKKIVVCELNLGQFVNYLKAKFPKFDYRQYNKIQGLPFTVIELKNNFNKILEDK